MKRTWAIYSYPVGFKNAGGIIETSIGCPYTVLKKIAQRMCCNGEGYRYEVREIRETLEK